MRAYAVVIAFLPLACAKAPPPKTTPEPVRVPSAETEASSAASQVVEVEEAPPRAAPESAGESSGSANSAEVHWHVTVDSDGGRVVVRSTPDAGFKAWGTFDKTDSGFSFSGGFSTHADASFRFSSNPDAGAP